MSFLIPLVAAMLATPEAPFDPSDQSRPEFSTASRYQACIARIEEDAALGRMEAEQWRSVGGGAPALHCLAIADLAAGFPKLAAVRLLEASGRPDAGDSLLRARLLEQAALAWLEGDEIDSAKQTVEQALTLAPNSGELSLTAGVIYAAGEQWQKTIDAVSAAEEAGIVSIGGYLARARAYKALSKNRQSADDVVAILKIEPTNLDALVLRGELRQVGIDIKADYKRSAQSKPQ